MSLCAEVADACRERGWKFGGCSLSRFRQGHHPERRQGGNTQRHAALRPWHSIWLEIPTTSRSGARSGCRPASNTEHLFTSGAPQSKRSIQGHELGTVQPLSSHTGGAVHALGIGPCHQEWNSLGFLEEACLRECLDKQPLPIQRPYRQGSSASNQP